MSINYEYSIDQLTVNPLLNGKSDVVTQVIWTLNGVSNDVSGSWSSSTEVPYEQLNTFIPFEQLTKNDVLAWIESHTSPGYIDNAKIKIAADIQQQIAPDQVYMPVPWA